MPTLEIMVSLKLNGIELESMGFPFRRRLEVDEVQPFDTTFANGLTNTDPGVTGQIANIQVLVLAGTQALTARLNGQSDAGIDTNTDGFFVVMDGTIDAGATTNLVLTNASGSDAQIRGIAGGT